MKGLLFTYGMTYGGAVVSLFHPFYGFLIYVAFANLKPDALWFYSVPEGNYSRTIAIAFLFGWIVHGMGSWNFGKGAATVGALLFYWVWMLLSTCLSPAQKEAWYSFEIFTKIFLPLVAGLTMIDSVAKLKQVAWVLVLTNGYLAWRFNELYFDGYVNDESWTFAGMDNNFIAFTMVTALGLTFFVGMHADKWWQKAIAFASAGLIAHVVLFSFSRGGMLGMAITGLVAFVLTPKRPMHYLSLAIALAIVLRLAGPEVRKEFMSSFADEEDRDASAESRVKLTKDAIDCMLRHPFTGCGMENWVNMAPDYGWPRGKRAHNTWAETGANLGIPGLLGIFAVYGCCCWPLLKLTRERTPVDDPFLRGLARGVLAGLTGFFVAAIFITADRVEVPFYLILLGAGTLKVYSLGEATSTSTAAVQRIPALLSARFASAIGR